MEPVALAIWGKPTTRSKLELRFGTKSSVSINLKQGTWYDHEAGEGGGVLDAIKMRGGAKTDREAFEWMEQRHLWVNGHGRRANGHDPQKKTTAWSKIGEWDYTDEYDTFLFRVQKFSDPASGQRTFRQGHFDQNGNWLNHIRGVRRVPYRLPELLEALANDRVVFIVEGEKDVDTCWNVLGIPATCNPMGAGKWPKMAEDLNPHFIGANVVVIADNDDAGRDHVQQVAKELQQVAQRVRVLEVGKFWNGCRAKGDITDWVQQTDITADLIYQIAEKLPDWSEGSHDEQPGTAFVQSSADFTGKFKPPDYLIDGILQRRFLYSFTGKTGAGKTAVVLLIAASVALGRKVGDIEVQQGRVLYFAGENPDDVRMRWIAMAQHMDFDPETIPVYFIEGAFKISQLRQRIFEEVARIGDIALVIIDTSAAYYEGVEVNSNTEQIQHARRFRSLIEMTGGPCVLAACHPVKNAANDNLLPLGAGAFLNEVDGNLTSVADYPAIEVHWQGKFRGADFDPMCFQLHSVTHERLKNAKGKLIPTVIAKHLSEAAKEDIARANLSDRQRLFAEIEKDGKASVSEYAARCGWLIKNQKPNKNKVHRMIALLKKLKLVSGEPGDYHTLKSAKSERKNRTADDD
jgi:hypothetical protein